MSTSTVDRGSPMRERAIEPPSAYGIPRSSRIAATWTTSSSGPLVLDGTSSRGVGSALLAHGGQRPDIQRDHRRRDQRRDNAAPACRTGTREPRGYVQNIAQ